jgi:hypothetical protein
MRGRRLVQQGDQRLGGRLPELARQARARSGLQAGQARRPKGAHHVARRLDVHPDRAGDRLGAGGRLGQQHDPRAHELYPLIRALPGRELLTLRLRQRPIEQAAHLPSRSQQAPGAQAARFTPESHLSAQALETV